MQTNIRNWYDITIDGNGGQASRNVGIIAPFVNLNTTMDSGRKILSNIYFDISKNQIRLSKGRSPIMEYQVLVNTNRTINGLIGDTDKNDISKYTFFYFDSINLYGYSNILNFNNSILLSNFVSNNSNNATLKKCITSNYSLYLFSYGSSIYYLNNVFNGMFIPVIIVNDWDGTNFNCTIDDNSGNYYLIYSSLNTFTKNVLLFNNHITDLVGNITYNPGQNNKNAAYFLNNNLSQTPSNYMLVPNTTNLPITISIWFKTDSLNNQTPFFLFDSDLTGTGLRVEIFNGSIRVSFALPLPWITVSSSNWPNTDTVISINTWYHLCITIDMEFNASVYLNNSLLGSVGGVSSLQDYSAFMLGGTTGNGFRGLLQFFNVYNRVLTINEITSLYNLLDISNGRVINLPLDGVIVNPNYTVIGKLIDTTNIYKNPELIYNNPLEIYLSKNLETNIYKGIIDNSGNIILGNRYKNLIKCVPILYLNNVSLIGMDSSFNLVNRSTYTNTSFNLNNKSQLYNNNIRLNDNIFDIALINDEYYIYYVGTDNLVHQVWNPIMFQKIIINTYVTTITSNLTMWPLFTVNGPTDFILQVDDNINAVNLTLTINNAIYNFSSYPGQNIQVNDLSGNNYYFKITPDNVVIPDNTVIHNNYIPGYYCTVGTFGSDQTYYTIYDCYGCPVWYKINTSQKAQGGNNPKPCGLFLGNDINKVVCNIFDGFLPRTIVNIDTLEEFNYYILPDSRGNTISWDSHEALEIKLPLSRKGNMLIQSYTNGCYLQEQNRQRQIVWEWWSIDYLTSTDPEDYKINSSSVHPITGDIICSFRQQSSVFCISYTTKQILWAIDSNNTFYQLFRNASLTQFLNVVDEPIINGVQYYGTSGQYDAQWNTDLQPIYDVYNYMISIFDNQSFYGRPNSRGVVYEIDIKNVDLSGNGKAYFRGNSYSYYGGKSGYMGSNNIIKEDNETFSWVINYPQLQPCLQEFASDSYGMGTQTLLFEMSLPGDHYRISKAPPNILSIEAMRRTSNMPFSTPSIINSINNRSQIIKEKELNNNINITQIFKNLKKNTVNIANNIEIIQPINSIELMKPIEQENNNCLPQIIPKDKLFVKYKSPQEKYEVPLIDYTIPKMKSNFKYPEVSIEETEDITIFNKTITCNPNTINSINNKPKNIIKKALIIKLKEPIKEPIIQSINKPINKPVVESNKPVKQVVQQTKPVVQQTKSVLQQTKSVLQQTKSVVQQTKSVVQQIKSFKPIVQQIKPIIIESKPIVVESKPIIAESKPIFKSPPHILTNSSQSKKLFILREKK
jgi:hypothetical protein